MPQAHLCQSCGHDLARLHPAREPLYAWPLVRCPNCATPHLRATGMGEDRMAWRRARKVFKALLGLLGRTGGVLLLTLLMTAVIATLEQETRMIVPRGSAAAPLVLLGIREPVPTSFIQTRADWFQHGGNLLLLAGWVFGCVLSTVFLCSLLRHRRWWLLIAAWAAWIAAVLFLTEVAVPALYTWSETGSFGLTADVNTSGLRRGPAMSGHVAAGLARTPGQFGWVAASAVIMLVITPAAVLVRAVAASLVRLQRRKLRRSIRRRSQSA